MALGNAFRMFFSCYYFFSLLLSFLFNIKSTGILVLACPLRLPSIFLKVIRKMDPIFELPVFDSAREKMKSFIKQLEKSQETFESFAHLFQMWQQQCFFYCKIVQVCSQRNVCIQRVPRLPQ